jgi:uncharacterized spore protein YtfJ
MMAENLNEMMDRVDRANQERLGVLEKLFSTARADSVFSTPVTQGGRTIITAAEVGTGGGFGSGMGFGSGTGMGWPRGHRQMPVEGSSADTQAEGAGGGGGGGGAMARPVAAIIIDSDGVTIQPILDITKIVLALVAALGAMLAIYGRMFRGGKHGRG